MGKQLFEIPLVRQIILLMIVPEIAGHLTEEPIEVSDPAKALGLNHHSETWILEEPCAYRFAHGVRRIDRHYDLERRMGLPLN